MIFKIFITLSALLCGITIQAQDLSLYEKRVLVEGNDSLPYRIMYPENYEAGKEYPLVLFLHGAGERGNDNEKQLIHGSRLFADDAVRKKFPAIVVFPQCARNNSWANYKTGVDSNGKRIFQLYEHRPATSALMMVEKLLSSLIETEKVDDDRIYVGGLSMGGMGTFELCRRNPDLFAAAFPICGATDASIADDVDDISWWIFHGAKDDVVPPASSIAMAAALKKEKADVRFTLYPDANHNSWDPAFAEPELLPWLFSKKN